MDISQRGIEHIVSFEGKHKLMPDGTYKAYLDTLASPPVWTLYCGLTRGIHKGSTCTEEEGQRMFQKELAVYEDAVERLISVPLNQNQFDALVSFTYNCGVGALQRSTLRRVLNQGKYDQVPTQLMRWVYAGGTKYRGLERRRAAEGALFMEPMPEEEPEIVVVSDGIEETEIENPMPQRVEEATGDVKEAVKESWTIRGALVSLFGGITATYDWLTATAVEAASEAAAIKQTVGPFEALWDSTKDNAQLVIGIAIVVGSVIAISRRIDAAREKKIG